MTEQFNRSSALLSGLLALAICSAGCAHAQTPEEAPDLAMLPAWQGEWIGELTNLPLREGAPDIDVRLEIGVGEDPGDGCLIWRSTYFNSDEILQVKDHKLCRTDEPIRFVLDEGGGIELDLAIFGDTAYSVFQAKDVFLSSHQRIDGDHMVQEIFYAPAKGRTVGEITAYPTKGLQRIVYARAKPAAP